MKEDEGLLPYLPGQSSTGLCLSRADASLERVLRLPDESEFRSWAKLSLADDGSPLTIFLLTYARFFPRKWEQTVADENESEGESGSSTLEELRLERILSLLLRVLQAFPMLELKESPLFKLPFLLDMCSLCGMEARAMEKGFFSWLSTLVEGASRLSLNGLEGDMTTVASGTQQILEEALAKILDDNAQPGVLEELANYVAEILSSLACLVLCKPSLGLPLLSNTELLDCVCRLYERGLPLIDEKGYLRAGSQAAKSSLSLIHALLVGSSRSTSDSLFCAIMELSSAGSGHLLAHVEMCFALSERVTSLLGDDEDRSGYLRSILLNLAQEFKGQSPPCSRLVVSVAQKAAPVEVYSSVHEPTTRDGSLAASRASRPPSNSIIREKVAEIQSILGGPDAEGGLGVGEGYAEACLQLLNWSTEAVVGALLDGKPPPQLSNVPRSLGRVWKGKRAENDTDYERDEETAKLSAERIHEEERREELEIFMLERYQFGEGGGQGEYNDDYDDQWDEYEPHVGGTGETGLDQAEATLFYNRAVRAAEAEEEWWDGMRNRNRERTEVAEVGEEQEDGSAATEQHRLQQGRQQQKQRVRSSSNLMDSGGVGGGAAVTSAALAQDKRKLALQRRRKDKNKAAVGNHHRKDRALRKGAF